LIPDRERKIGEILGIITNGCLPSDIDPNKYGPSLYFYKRVMDSRGRSNSIIEFLEDEANIELLYATLVSWDMDSRRAEMLYFDDVDKNFKENFLACSSHFQFLEDFQINDQEDWEEYLSMIRETYEYSHVMNTIP
jgi:hypothetical protein